MRPGKHDRSADADPTRYGYTRAQWDAAVDAGVRILKDVAGLGPRDGSIGYTDLCERVFALTDVRVVPGEFALPQFLGDISRVTLETDDCAITALVVYKDSEDAGKGLYHPCGSQRSPFEEPA